MRAPLAGPTGSGSRIALALVSLSGAAAVMAVGGCAAKDSTNGSAGYNSAATTAPGLGTPPTDAAGSATGPVAATVDVKNIAFKPSKVTVAAGQSVKWTFDDGDIPHNVNFTTFRSGDPVSSGSYTHTFTTAGLYTYHCDVHPNMQGTVQVTG